MANDIGVTASGFHVFRFDPPCDQCGHRMYVQTPDGIDDYDLLSFAVAQNHRCSLGRDQWCHYQHSNHTNDGTHQCLCFFCGTEHISCAGFLHVCGIPVADEPRRLALGPLPPLPPVWRPRSAPRQTMTVEQHGAKLVARQKASVEAVDALKKPWLRYYKNA